RLPDLYNPPGFPETSDTSDPSGSIDTPDTPESNDTPDTPGSTDIPDTPGSIDIPAGPDVPAPAVSAALFFICRRQINCSAKLAMMILMISSSICTRSCSMISLITEM